MPDHACHLCDQLNPVGARYCVACGVGLVLECAQCGRVRPALALRCDGCGALDAAAELRESDLMPVLPAAPARGRRPPAGFEPSAWGGLPVLSLDDVVANAPAPAPAMPVLTDAFAAVTGRIDDTGPPSLRLRDIDRPDGWVLPDGAPVPPPPAPRDDTQPRLVRTDSFSTPPGALPTGVDIALDLEPSAPPRRDGVTVAMPLPVAAEPAPFVDHRDAKAARRAAVRRARLAAQASGLAPEPMPTDLLVVDADDASRQRLCLLLDAFGFNVQSSRSTAHAVALLASRVYLAVFADVDLQDARPEGGVEVARLAREGGPLPDGRRPALIVMSARPSAAERVRAALAGSEQFLVKPLTRGDVARALEACDIPLPSDPRRG